MKIKRVKWSNHPILGDLELDLTNSSTGEAYQTVIFVGENGTGKSTILEALSSFLNIGSFNEFEFIEYSVDGLVYKAKPTMDGTTNPNFFDIEYITEGGMRNVRADKDISRDMIDYNPSDIRHHGCVFSKARSDYKTNKITSITTISLDTDKYDDDKSDNFTSLKQLVVDIVNQDSLEYMQLNKSSSSSTKSWDEFYPTSKTYRFQNAFDNFFDKLSYDRVADHAGEKTIFFKKNGYSIPVDKLSSGEKQIVFRGIYLLKNSGILNGSTILIDEPELSIHPKWERRILQYYKDLFTQNNQQKVQMFFATHSDHVLKNALSDKNNNIVIVLEENSGIISPKKIDSPSVLPSITYAETNYIAFDLVSNDFHAELYGWLQDKESKKSVKSCDDFITTNLHYDPSIHAKPSLHGTTTYATLSTYIRNAIHHPDSGNTFTDEELRCSTELLIKLCR